MSLIDNNKSACRQNIYNIWDRNLQIRLNLNNNLLPPTSLDLRTRDWDNKNSPFFIHHTQNHPQGRYKAKTTFQNTTTTKNTHKADHENG